MARTSWIIVAAALFAAATIYLCFNRNIPLGVPGEWVWNRHQLPTLLSLIPVVVTAAIFILLCVVGRRTIERSRWTAGPMLGVTMLAAVPFHVSLFLMPTAPFGPERWIMSLHNPASSGYFSVARDSHRPSKPVRSFHRESPSEFLSGYESWIAKQDSFHIGTHPPGLFLAYRWLFEAMDEYPIVAECLWRYSPDRMTTAFTQVIANEGIKAPTDYAVLAAAALAPWLAFWLSSTLVYALARHRASPTAAYSVASLWLLAPGPLLFLPLADVFYVLFSTAIAGLLIVGANSRPGVSIFLGAIAGLLFVAAINLSLAFVVVLMFAFLVPLATDGETPFRLRWWATWSAFVVAVFGATLWLRIGLNFNLPAVLAINLEKHRGFYDAFPRSYWPWVGVNLIEFAVTLSVLFVAMIAAAIGRSRRTSGMAWALLATLLLLDLTGKNLSEAARLWLFLTPLAAAAAAPAFEGESLGARAFGALLFFQADLAACVYAAIEPLLPISVPL
jgi:methylthioxylose transferase